jgi:ABC-type ATPase with predicted acetyltransferase domain
VFDAFGLNIDDYSHVVVDGIKVPQNWDLIYITGISGSGKSTLLKSLSDMHDFDSIRYSTHTMYSMFKSEDRPLIDCLGSSFENALSLLNSVGLSEAFIYFKSFKQLSEGQKYRFYLAKLLELDNEVILVDEFASMLDRITANIVSYNYQKAVRRYGKRLILATSHDDLTGSLCPSHRITFLYSGEHKIEKLKYPRNNHRPPYLDEIEFVSIGQGSDTSLLKYHYKNTKLPAMITSMYNALFRGYPIGLIVYSIPIRTYMLGQFNMTPKERERYESLSVDEKRLLSGNNTAIVSRVVIHPTFRGIGLGAHLLRETLPRVNKRVIVLSSVMSNYIAFCESAGMTLIEPKSNLKFKRLTQFFDKHSIDKVRIYYDSDYRSSVMQTLKQDKKHFSEFIELISQYIKKYFSSLGDRGEMEIRKIASSEYLEKYLLKLRPTNVKTYYWVNSHVPLNYKSVSRYKGKLIHKRRKGDDVGERKIVRRRRKVNL